MYERKIIPNLNCVLDFIGEVLYGKWKIRLLWFIDQGYKRPSELQRKIPDVSRRVPYPPQSFFDVLYPK
ncbi:winged helix-turn-helix transcriptional regulator [Sphingobacterium sp. GVS05A]|uniref:winged helix-turn-helix transcriptional regulator n=1 Tax=Sphingobacterium TaxID=28453 RepID=UPI001CC0C5CF|nr:winged helix-turn-helix transcriptional regulator [Sphingobacterium sp. GVS05A]